MHEIAPHVTGLSRYCTSSSFYRPGEAAAAASELVERLRDEERVVVVLGRPSLAESASLTAAAVTELAALPNVSFLSTLRRSNVHGALDMGLAPGILPGRVELDAGRDWFSQEWGAIPEAPGTDTAGILAAAAEGRITGLILLGADPLADFPDRHLAQRGLEGAGFVVAVECFETDWAFAAEKNRSHVARHGEGGVPRGQLFPSGPEQTDDTIYSPLASPIRQQLNGEMASIGRASDCTIPIKDRYLSRKHAEIAPVNGAWVLKDCGSANGTFLNDPNTSITEARLTPGDALILGGDVARFVYRA